MRHESLGCSQHHDVGARALRAACFLMTCFYAACFFCFVLTFFPVFRVCLDRGIFWNAAENEKGRRDAPMPQERRGDDFRAPAAPRNLFKVPPPQPVKLIAPSPSAGPDIFERMMLVGIIEDGLPRAVLEDQKTAQTYFLSPGDMVADMKVVEIRNQEVVFENAQGRRRLTM